MPALSTKESVKAHTEAKLQFYVRYLDRYLRILLLTPYVEQINIYDLFCGAGLYEDGKSGSAIRALETIEAANSEVNGSAQINLLLNDIDKSKIDTLKAAVDASLKLRAIVQPKFWVAEAEELFAKLPVRFSKQSNRERNLVFVDPYGYKTVSWHSVAELMVCGRTEVMIFLPIMNIYRFLSKTTDEMPDASILPLIRLVEELGLHIDKISSERELIDHIEQALAFDKTILSASYPIRNSVGHYYAVFFITKNMLGLEKIVEVKWELDEAGGEQFNNSPQNDFLIELDKQDRLQASLQRFISEQTRTNTEIYEYVLKLGFLPKHANAFLRKWQNEESLTVSNADGTKARKGSFKLNYKEFQLSRPSLIFKIQ